MDSVNTQFRINMVILKSKEDNNPNNPNRNCVTVNYLPAAEKTSDEVKNALEKSGFNLLSFNCQPKPSAACSADFKWLFTNTMG